MRFTLDDAFIQHLSTNGFTAASAEQLLPSWGSHWQQHLNAQSPNAPTWWRTPGTNEVRVYCQEPYRKDSGGSSIYIWIDGSSKTGCSCSSAWN